MTANEVVWLEAVQAMERIGKELDSQPVPKNPVDVQRYMDMLRVVLDCLDPAAREELMCDLAHLVEVSA